MAIKKKQGAPGQAADLDPKKVLAKLQKDARATIAGWFKLKKLGALDRLPDDFNPILFQMGIEPLTDMNRRGRPKTYKGINFLPELKAIALAAARQSIKANKAQSQAEQDAAIKLLARIEP